MRRFNSVFWNSELECLYDVVDREQRDASIRPNQIIAVSLQNSMLNSQRSRAVVDKVEAELLTPVGLRTLAPSDPRYRGHYVGTPYERDSAYHQGTVWAWLIGPFVDAYRKVHSQDPRATSRIAEILETLSSMVSGSPLSTALLGSVPEIFDGEAPHAPRGAPAQAWSVAELLRVSSK
jgi:glycogen debranching enzyme